MLGGTRSGKSALAEGLARDLGGDRVLYVATADLAARDPDLRHRVEEHRARRPGAWETLEVGGGRLLRAVEASASFRVVLLDSLTLWAAARLADAEGALGELDETLAAAEEAAAQFVVVSDEVGMGVVPESEAGREFRDLLGLANARVAAAAREVHLCVAGIGLRIK